MKKVIRIGKGPHGNVYCKIEIKNKEGKGPVLSITGVEGPLSSGNCRGSCGQIVGHITISTYAPGWDKPLLDKFTDIWEKWHLNNMRAACEHQREDPTFNPREELELIDFSWGDRYYSMRTKAQAGELSAEEYTEFQAVSPKVHSTTAKKFLTPEIEALITGGWIKEGKHKTKTAGWIRVEEHPRGLLGKVCSVCGYKYGSAWLYEPLPQEVVDFLAALPYTDMTPAWV